MRPAIEVATQICGCADARQRKADIARIKADRAELVAEIVAELRDEAHMAHIRRPDPDAALQAYAAALSNAADAIEAKFGGRDG